MFAGPGPHGGL